VHKDLALWNVMGNAEGVLSVIDWEDAISGDPTDDISLMACFHSAKEINTLMEGYQTERSLPDNFFPRFWLHLLRNMIVKAVIRVGSGYFDRNKDFFLFNAQNSNGVEFHDFTITRLKKALEGLNKNKEVIDL
jgi:Ser/Thr protein kinase RdoA (MazF antagonist)